MLLPVCLVTDLVMTFCALQLREWDSETSTNTNTLHCKNAVYDLSASPQNPTITAFAGAGKALHIWDARQRSADGSVSSFKEQIGVLS